MNVDLAIVLALLIATTVMFAINRPRMDAVALLMMTLLPLTGVISVSDALAGLSDPNIVLIAALFVLGEGLVRTGVAQRLGDFLARRAGSSETRLILLMMAVVAGLGSFMSSTGVVAIFLPAVLRIARNSKISPSRLLMPVSTAALISGMMTLIATPPNLVVHGELVRAGFEGFGFFTFSMFGIPILAVAIGYMMVARRWLASNEAAEAKESGRPSLAQWLEEYELEPHLRRLRVSAKSPCVAMSLGELGLRTNTGVNILAIERSGRFAPTILGPAAHTTLEIGDTLFVDLRHATVSARELEHQYGLQEVPLTGSYLSDTSQPVGMAELMIPATSRLVGQTLIESGFRSEHKLSVVGMKRGNQPVAESVRDEPLRVGDTLLVAGPWRSIARLQNDPNEVIVLNTPAELDDVIDLPARAPYALGTLVLMVGMMITGVVPNVMAALIACLLLGLFRCVNMTTAYRAIQWPTIFLIVGMLPFSFALQKTGGVDAAVQLLLGGMGVSNPTILLVILYALTVVLGLFVSNTATAVLMAPVAMAIAGQLGLSPYPFAMTVALASSAAFLTPVSSPVNALVVGPGNYRFADFVRVGAPLSALVMIVNIVLIRIFLPF